MDFQDEPRRGLSRRKLLERSLVAGVGLTVPGVLAACGGGDDETATTPGTSAAAPGTSAAAPATSAAAPATSAAAPATTEATTGTSAADTATTVAGEAPVRGGRITVGMPIPATDNLDPQNFVASGDKVRAFNVAERLAMINPDGTVKLHLAESVEPLADDATRWRVTLRSGITHSNGKDLTSADLLHSWQRLATDSPHATSLTPFVDLAQSKATDPLTVEFTLKRAVGDFERFIAQEAFGIFPEGQTTFDEPEDLIGTGPYKVAEWTAGERYVMVRNENYWEEGKPYLDEVEILNLSQDDDQAGALLSGQIDGTTGLPEDQIRRLEGDDNAQLIVSPGIYTPTWYMRLDSDAFADVRVRQAFKLAVDRQQCVDVQFGGRGTPGNDLIGPLFPSYNSDLPQREYDPDQARALLKEAGREGMEVELVCATYAEGATAFAEQAKAAGINIKINAVPTADIYNTDLYYLKVPFGETLWTGSFEEMSPNGLFADATYNETAWKRPEWDERFLQGYATIDEQERYRIYGELQETLWNEGGYIVWATADLISAARPDVRGVIPWGTVSWWNGLRFEDIWRVQ